MTNSAAQAAPAIHLSQVYKSYRRSEGEVPALENVTFDVMPGEIVALMGPSGCGKSTTLNVISGVDRCDSGKAIICGLDMSEASESDLNDLRRSKIGIVFQQFYLMPLLTVEENVALPLSLAGMRDRNRVRELIHRVGLENRMQHYPTELSGGEQQRAAIARALVHRPKLILADEPTGNLDSHNGRVVLELLYSLRAESGTALLLVTHDAKIAARADRILQMNDGKIG